VQHVMNKSPPPFLQVDFHQLSEQQEAALLERRLRVEGWVGEFASKLDRRRPPAVRISPATTYYAPISNKLVVSANHLLGLDDGQLRVVVGHEMGALRPPVAFAFRMEPRRPHARRSRGGPNRVSADRSDARALGRRGASRCLG